MGSLIALGKTRTLYWCLPVSTISGFFDMLMQCFYLKDPQDCSRLIAEANGNLSNVKAMFVELFREIRKRARDDTKVVLVGYPYASLSDDFNLIDVDFSFTLLSTYPAAKNVRQLGRDLDKIQGEAVDAANTEAAESLRHL